MNSQEHKSIGEQKINWNAMSKDGLNTLLESKKENGFYIYLLFSLKNIIIQLAIPFFSINSSSFFFSERKGEKREQGGERKRSG